MAKAIYKFWRTRPTGFWYQLSKEHRDEHLAKMQHALEEVGGKSVLMCDADWSSEEWRYVGVESFPDIEAVHAYARRLHAIDHYRYFHSESMLGTEVPWPTE